MEKQDIDLAIYSSDESLSDESTQSDRGFIDDSEDSQFMDQSDPDFEPKKYSSSSGSDPDPQFIAIEVNCDDIRVCYVDHHGFFGAPVTLQHAYEALWILREYIKETLSLSNKKIMLTNLDYNIRYSLYSAFILFVYFYVLFLF